MANNSKYTPVTKKHLDGLQKLLKLYGTQQSIADSLGLKRQTINNWFSGRLVIPEGHAIRLCKQCQNRIDFNDLRPDYKKI